MITCLSCCSSTMSQVSKAELNLQLQLEPARLPMRVLGMVPCCGLHVILIHDMQRPKTVVQMCLNSTARQGSM